MQTLELTNILWYPIRQALEEYGNPQDSMSVRKKIIGYIDKGHAVYQFIELVRGLLSGVDVSLYEDPSLSSDTMRLIRYNLKEGIDVSMYTRQGFTFHQSSEIVRGLQSSLDISWYANKEFTPKRMQVIRRGLEEGFDVSSYANPDMPADEMQQHLDKLRRQSRMTERNQR